MKHKVWTVVISHKHGIDVSVANSPDQAEEIVAEWAREWWDAVTCLPEDVIAEEYEKKHGRKEMIRFYFDSDAAFGGSEYADITEHEIELPS